MLKHHPEIHPIQASQGLHLPRQGFHIADGQDIVSQDVALHQSALQKRTVTTHLEWGKDGKRNPRLTEPIWGEKPQV